MAFVVSSSIEFSGDAALVRAMKELSGPERDAEIVDSLKEGAMTIVVAAKGKCPVATGALRESIRTHEPKIFHDAIATRVLAGSQVVRGAGGAGESGIVGANALGDPWYAHLVEYGHKIGKRPKALNHKRIQRLRLDGKPIPNDWRMKEVPAQPFLRPGFDEKKDAVLARMRDRFFAFLDKKWAA